MAIATADKPQYRGRSDAGMKGFPDAVSVTASVALGHDDGDGGRTAVTEGVGKAFNPCDAGTGNKYIIKRRKAA